MKKLLRSLYHRIPDQIKLGPAYCLQRSFIQRSQTWPPEKMFNWQLRKLKDLLKSAYEYVPYYRTLFDEITFDPDRFSSPADLKRIPILTREEVVKSGHLLISNKYPRRTLALGRTGGTTGTPLELYYQKRTTSAIENAFVHDIWGKFGHRPNRKTVWARVSDLSDKLYDVRGLKLLVACGQLQKATFAEVAAAIRRFDPPYLFGYPSSLYLLGRFMQDGGLPRFDSIRLIMCSSENLEDDQKQFLCAYFGAPVCNLYGNSERTVIAGNRPGCDLMHFYPQYGFVEILDQRGQECTEAGATGEIISTPFTSPAFPLIRYRTGDFATGTDEECGCGWNYRVVRRVHGREQEYIVTASGEKRPFIATVNMHSGIFSNVIQFQMFQPRPGIVQIQVIPKSGLCVSDEVAMTAELQRLFGSDVKVTTLKVERMRLTKRGKFRFVIHGWQAPFV